MNRNEYAEFARKTESLVKPADITAIAFLGDFNKHLPLRTQHRMMRKGGKDIPYMGFIVDPYAAFLSYEILNREVALAMLPEGYELVESALFDGEEKKPLVVISAFSIRTSAFAGIRLEFYLIARNTQSGMVSWIIADYLTNTNSHDPKNGFGGYTSDPALLTVTPFGQVIAEFQSLETSDRLVFDMDVTKGSMVNLDQELWVDGNLSVDYGGKLKDPESEPFSLVFDPILMKEALRIPLSRVSVEPFGFLDGLINSAKPLSAAVFPYSQHFIIKQNMAGKTFSNAEDLKSQIAEFMQKSDFKTMSGKGLKKSLFLGFLVSAVINSGIIVFLLIKLLT